MAQVLKEDLRQSILEAARREFNASGFSGTSMRAIAAGASCSPGNIYNYFENKDDLFEAVLQDTLGIIRKTVERFHDPDRVFEDRNFFSIRDGFARLEQILEFADHHRDNLRLLVFNSTGSRLEKSVDWFIDEYTERELKIHEIIKERMPELQKRSPSPFIIRTMCRFMLETLIDFIRCDMTLEEMERHGQEMLNFIYNGASGYYKFPEEEVASDFGK